MSATVTQMKFSSELHEVVANQNLAVDTSSKTLIVVPCYNEEKRLNAFMFLSALRTLKNVNFLFVDDGSTDGTKDLLEALAAKAPSRISVLALARNGGKAEAVRQGLLIGSQSGADFIGYWDADLATPLDAITDMQRIGDRFDKVDVIFGSRMGLLGHRVMRDKSRRVVSRICNIMARTALNMPICDTQCGAKLLRNTDALKAAIENPFHAGWLFDIELFARIRSHLGGSSSSFFEMPLLEWQEVAGSKVSAKAVVRSGLQMLRLIAQNRLSFSATSTSKA